VQNEIFATELFGASQVAIVLWIVFRFLGTVVTVPLAEELLFRGYLLTRLARCEVTLEGRIAFSWVALIVSSILFGLLHSAWLAGIVAGLIYGWVRYRGDSIKDAVIAHAFTNLLLSVYVLSTGSWSLW
jgi:CAAX prenyl protease-like protein